MSVGLQPPARVLSGEQRDSRTARDGRLLSQACAMAGQPGQQRVAGGSAAVQLHNAQRVPSDGNNARPLCLQLESSEASLLLLRARGPPFWEPVVSDG